MIAVLSLVLLAGQPGLAATMRTAIDRGLRFDSPGVLDLASRSQQPAGAGPVATMELSSVEAARILAAPAISDDPSPLRFSDEVYGCTSRSRPCFERHEKALIDGANGIVRRDGKRLTIAPVRGTPAMFVDWIEPTTRSADGDEETHWYLGRLAGSGYERVEVRFGHDAPGSFLVNPRTGRTAFVHNGADLVAPSPDGRLLLTLNLLNPPLSLRVAALDAAGPRLVVRCAAPEGQDRLTLVFKGWRNAAAFDFVVEIGPRGGPTTRLAAELAAVGPRWIWRVGDIARLRDVGLACAVGEGG